MTASASWSQFRVITQVSEEGQACYHQDGLGSIVLITDDLGEALNRYEYDAFGTPDKLLETIHNPLLFTGEPYDENGLIFLRARYYDPATGRFLTRDTYLGTLDDPLSQHLYVYVANNPVLYVDPSGHLAICSGGAAEWYASMWWLCLVDTALPVGDAVYALGGLAIAAVELFTTNPQMLDYSIAAAGEIIVLADSREFNPPARRKTFSSKKAAREAAQKAGKGKPPRHDPHGHPGDPRPHYHPDVKMPKYRTPKVPTPHDHYYYPK